MCASVCHDDEVYKSHLISVTYADSKIAFDVNKYYKEWNNNERCGHIWLHAHRTYYTGVRTFICMCAYLYSISKLIWISMILALATLADKDVVVQHHCQWSKMTCVSMVCACVWGGRREVGFGWVSNDDKTIVIILFTMCKSFDRYLDDIAAINHNGATCWHRM